MILAWLIILQYLGQRVRVLSVNESIEKVGEFTVEVRAA